MSKTLVIRNVDLELLKSQIQGTYDLAYRERKKAELKKQPQRELNARNLDALLDMLSDAEVLDA